MKNVYANGLERKCPTEEQMSFNGVTYISICEGFLIEVEMTQSQLDHHPNMGDGSKSWKSGAHCTNFRKLHRLEGLGWS